MKTQDNKKRSRNIILRILSTMKQGSLQKQACFLIMALFVTPIGNTLHAQSDNLFQHVDRHLIDLTERQTELFNVVDSRPFTKEIRLVYLNFTQSLKQRESVRLNLPGDRIIDVQKRTVYENKGGLYTWSGKLDEGYATILLTVNEGNITGKVQTLDVHFIIKPLGNGLHALYEIDYSKLPPDHPDVDMEEFSGKIIGSNEFRKSVDNSAVKLETFNGENYQASSSTSSAIDLLVLYTEAVKNSVINIQDDIAAAMSELNDSMSNSNISLNVNLASTYEVNYQESGLLDTDLLRLQDPAPGYMDEVHGIRESNGANLVILIVAPPCKACGFGFQNADYEKGFSIVRYDCIDTSNSFAHEIGHNVGAHHSRSCDFDHDSGSTKNFDYQYGHGYNVPEIAKSTIMACGNERINFWSNPLINWGDGPIQKLNQNSVASIQDNIPFGTFDFEYNAEVWREREAEVAALAPPPPLQVGIMGLNYFAPGTNGMWTSNISNGHSPYNYLWERSYNGISNWSVVSTNSSYSQSVTHEMWLRLRVTDNISQSKSDILHVRVTGCQNPPCPIPKIVDGDPAGTSLPESYALSQNYPNPFNPSSTIRYELPERADVSLAVYNMLGQRVAVLVDGDMQPGRHETVFEASNLSSGNYIARFTATGSSGEQFTQTLNMQLVK